MEGGVADDGAAHLDAAVGHGQTFEAAMDAFGIEDGVVVRRDK